MEVIRKIPSKTLICALRVAPSFYKAVQDAVDQSSDPTIVLFQGQAKTYPDGTINPTLFVQDDFDDHPGNPLTNEEKMAIEAKLRDPSYKLHIINSDAGEHANDRDSAGSYAIMHADIEYRDQGGVSTIIYDKLYDGNGRNDKKHIVEHTDDQGVTHQISEGNIPTGFYAPLRYKRDGASHISVFDPHSKRHRDNLTNAFTDAGVTFNSTLKLIADNMVKRHKKAILKGKFRLGAPDGWDKKDDPERNEAIVRVQIVAKMIWDKMPELHSQYNDFETFLSETQFGIIKVREAAYQGAPARAKFKELIGDVKGCVCELLDDLADSGNSLVQSGTALLQAGAKKVDASICHGPAAEESLDLILQERCDLAGEDDEEKSVVVIDHLTLTNTMPRVESFYESLPDKNKKHATLLNCADQYIAYLCQPTSP